MGGASRNDKKRRQEAANQRLAAAGIQVPAKAANRTPLIVVGVVLVVAVVIAAAVLYFRNSANGTAAAPTYTATVSGAVVTAGTGKVVVDSYEDFLCPICNQFEKRYSAQIVDALNSGKISVRYHTIAILDPSSNPAGYSTRAANAAVCSVSAGIYPAYRAKLFAEQPAEGSAGLSNEQLIKFGTDLGAKGDFAGCVNGGTNTAAVTAETKKAIADPALQTNGQFGTPTLAINGKKVDLNDSNWLKNAITAG
ncbi:MULTISPECIES: thioredoxin domain-containing protein [unclassified Pseudonocardia]|uniref:DsbA family protein n=1 Tax=unclassified Pseudonocardia TaxID=2619320 RepID=UPI00095EB386|nr:MULTISPECIES: thioredoxin domain-containing protein [unclassified Pseudonocardia]MBN9099743.1 thioredoxin domain-containing protein [Pseudonocardia sp.]OJY45235.1 MAG: protein-disulfide isomerase [Pseudonocardia sp. 73-21]